MEATGVGSPSSLENCGIGNSGNRSNRFVSAIFGRTCGRFPRPDSKPGVSLISTMVELHVLPPDSMKQKTVRVKIGNVETSPILTKRKKLYKFKRFVEKQPLIFIHI